MGDVTLAQFGAGFVWGAAAAAYQIEGAPAEDGKGPSVWDVFSHRRGTIRTGETGDRACDHYHRFRDDVALMKQLGLKAYRGSISWPRVQPEGRGAVNLKGLDYYSRLTDSLLEAGVEPWFTLFHWDLPWALQRDQRGFVNRDTAYRFADYAELVVRALGDRVKHWFTVNEPFEFACFGHLLGTHAPGLRAPWLYFRVMHHLLLGHGLALQRIRAAAPDAQAGIVLSHTPVRPRTASARDAKAAFLADQFLNRITLDPVLKGRYPEALFRQTRLIGPRIEPGDLEVIAAPADFVGLNYYSRETAFFDPFTPLLWFSVTGKDGGRAESDEPGHRTTAMGWEVWPQGLGDLANLLRTEYGNPPVIITENGAAFTDVVEQTPAGRRVADGRRVAFLRDYLEALRGAMDAGADVRGYFVWSLMDNFEWAEGYRPRFGLVHVDFETQQRTIKDSGLWYRDLIRAQQEQP